MIFIFCITKMIREQLDAHSKIRALSIEAFKTHNIRLNSLYADKM